MKVILSASLALLAGLAAQAACAADCTEPTPIHDVPNGASASRDEMLAAQRAIKAYDNAVREYVTCLQRAGDVSIKTNMIIDKVQKLTDKFNQELTTFKARSSSD